MASFLSPGICKQLQPLYEVSNPSSIAPLTPFLFATNCKILNGKGKIEDRCVAVTDRCIYVIAVKLEKIELRLHFLSVTGVDYHGDEVHTVPDFDWLLFLFF